LLIETIRPLREKLIAEAVADADAN
jgi:hypothetical protein